MSDPDTSDSIPQPSEPRPVVLTRVDTEQEAAMMCGALRAAGIRCAHDAADRALPGLRSVSRMLLGQPQVPHVAVYVAAEDRADAEALLMGWQATPSQGDDEHVVPHPDVYAEGGLEALRAAVDAYVHAEHPPPPNDCPRLNDLYAEVRHLPDSVLDEVVAAIDPSTPPSPRELVVPYLEERLEMEAQYGPLECRDLAARYLAQVRQLQELLGLIPPDRRNV